VGVRVAGLGLAGQDEAGRVVLSVALEAIGALRRCLSVELSAQDGAAGAIRPTSVDLIRRPSGPRVVTHHRSVPM
jgi:hypothetical protein